MATQPEHGRRRLLRSIGALAALGLAGCVGQSDPAGDESAGTTTTATTTTATTTTATTTETGDDHHEQAAHHGDDETTHEEGAGHGADGPADHVEVEMITEDGHHFHPHVAWVRPGGTVTFRNVSGAHSVAAYHPDNDKPRRVPDGAASFDSGILSEEGATFEHTFETEGVYDVYCEPHESLGMIGSVVVGEPDPHDQPGLAAPQDEFPAKAAGKIESLNAQVEQMLGHTHGTDSGGDAEGTDHDDEEHTEDGHHDDEEGHHGDGHD